MTIQINMWMPLDQAVTMLKEHMLFSGNNFVLDNLEYKYVDARIDMRMGSITLRPGNKVSDRWFSHQVAKEGGPWLGAARTVMQECVRGGDTATWNSDTMVSCSMRTLEQIAAAAVAADRNARRST